MRSLYKGKSVIL